MSEEIQDRFKLEEARTWIEQGFGEDDTQSLRVALKGTLQAAYDNDHKVELHKAVREDAVETIAAEAESDEEG
jgi:hypothetical protein